MTTFHGHMNRTPSASTQRRAAATARKMAEPATDAQFGFIRSLLTGRVVDPGIAIGITAIVDAAGTPEHPTKQQAANVITYLKGLPYTPREDAVTEPGYYEAEGHLFKVKRNRQATGIYAMKLGEHGWEYVPGGIHKLTTADAITEARAKELMA